MAHGLARWARVVLLVKDGLQDKEIAIRTGANADTAGIWRRRFA